MPLVRAVSGLLAVAAILAPTLVAKTKPKPAAVLSAYVKAMTPIRDDLLLADSDIFIVNLDLSGNIESEDEGKIVSAARILRAAQREYLRASRRTGTIRSPAALREAHSTLRLAERSQGLAAGALARKIESGMRGTTLLVELLDYDAAFETADEDERHWRAELIAQLRHFGLSVPRWVKDVGKSQGLAFTG